MILINGQWQGGGNRETLDAALALSKRIKSPFHMTSVSEEPHLKLAHGIYGFDNIREQTSQALSLLREYAPDRLLTVGGGCDADIASISYLIPATKFPCRN